MGIFDEVSEFFGKIKRDGLTQIEKVQEVESLVRECARDMAMSRDEIYVESLQKNTNVMVRQGEDKIKKFTSQGKMYISLPETIYDDIEHMNDFEQYHHVMDIMDLVLSAPEFREQNEDGDLNIMEAEVIESASKHHEDVTGIPLEIEHLVERDEFDQVSGMKDEKIIFEPKKYTAVKADGEEEEDEDDEAAKSCESSSPGDGSGDGDPTAISMQEINDEVAQEESELRELQVNQDFKSEYTSQSITDTEQKVVDDIKKSTFYRGRYGDGHEILDNKTIAKLMKNVQDITKALKGYDGKTKRLAPSKRLSSKDICNDISDKIYIGRDYVNGKFIDQNIVVDCSGSMGGQPIEDAVKLCFIFNKLAQEGLLEGCIILTESNENRHMEMPVHDDIIKSIGGTGGGEGLTKTLEQYKDKIRGKNVIVMTDGDLVEEPIPDKFWEKGRMTCIGMYVNEDVKAEDLPSYDKGMTRWFPKTIIRNSFDEAVQKLIQLGLRASKK